MSRMRFSKIAITLSESLFRLKIAEFGDDSRYYYDKNELAVNKPPWEWGDKMWL